MRRLRLLVLACLLLLAGTPAIAESALTVGAIYVGSVNDYGYNRAMKDGLNVMRAAIPGITLLEAENVPETAEAERVMEGMIQQGEGGNDVIEVLRRERQRHCGGGQRHEAWRIKRLCHIYLALPTTPATYQSKLPILSPPQASPSLMRSVPVLSVIGPVNGL